MKSVFRFLPILLALAWVWFYSVPALSPLRESWSENLWLLVLLAATGCLAVALVLTTRGVRWNVPFTIAALLCGGYLMMTVPSAEGERFVHLLSLENDLFGGSAQDIWARVREAWSASRSVPLDAVPVSDMAWWKPFGFLLFLALTGGTFQVARALGILLLALASGALILGLGEVAHLSLVPAVGVPFLILAAGAFVPAWGGGLGWLGKLASRKGKEKKKRSGRPAAVRMAGVRARIGMAIGVLVALPWVWFYSVPAVREAIAGASASWSGTDFPASVEWMLLVAVLGICLERLGQSKLSPLPNIRSCWFMTATVVCGVPYFVLTVPSLSFQAWVMDALGKQGAMDGGARFAIAAAALLLPMAPFYLALKLDKETNEVVPRFGFLGKWPVKLHEFLHLPLLAAVIAVMGEGGQLLTAFLAIVLPVLFVVTLPLLATVQEYAKEHPIYRRFFVLGRGGSARFGSVYSYLRYDFSGVALRASQPAPTREDQRQREARALETESASMLLGETLPASDPKLGCRPIGLDSEAHMLTVAMTGGGKSVFSAWNVLPVWPGGAFVLDPKGEHCQQTIHDRNRYGSCHVLDIWERTGRPSYHLASYNPLDAIDLDHPNAREDLNQIVSACLPEEKDESANSAHFRENARTVLMGYIVHVLSELPECYHNLPSVYDTILTGSPEGVAADPQAGEVLVDQMAVNEAVGKVAMSAAKILRDSGDREGGGYKTTVLKGLEWASGERFRQYLTKSTFSMRDVQNKRSTVYFVISIDDIRDYARFVKIIVNQGFLACREEAPHNKRTLFMLDEFAQLDTFKSAKEGLVTLRSRGVKLWLHNQHVGQLKESYGDIDAFLGQCDVQVFAVNDTATAEAISKRLGEYNERWLDGAEKTQRSVDKNYALRTPSEVIEDLRKGSGVQYVMPSDGNPMRLRLVPFSKRFKDRTGYHGNGSA